MDKLPVLKEKPIAPVPFPESKTVPATAQERELICEIQADIHELLSDIGAGVQEMRHFVSGEISDILADSKFTATKLMLLLDARPSVIKEMMNESEEESDVESLSTETLDGYLKILQKTG